MRGRERDSTAAGGMVAAARAREARLRGAVRAPRDAGGPGMRFRFSAARGLIGLLCYLSPIIQWTHGSLLKEDQLWLFPSTRSRWNWKPIPRRTRRHSFAIISFAKTLIGSMPTATRCS